METTAKLLIGIGAKIVRDPEVRECAPRYYYVLFEDPDGIRLEVNFVPDTGLLENDANFVSGEEFIRVDRENLTAEFHQSTSMSLALQTMKFATA